MLFGDASKKVSTELLRVVVIKGLTRVQLLQGVRARGMPNSFNDGTVKSS